MFLSSFDKLQQQQQQQQQKAAQEEKEEKNKTEGEEDKKEKDNQQTSASTSTTLTGEAAIKATPLPEVDISLHSRSPFNIQLLGRVRQVQTGYAGRDYVAELLVETEYDENNSIDDEFENKYHDKWNVIKKENRGTGRKSE